VRSEKYSGKVLILQYKLCGNLVKHYQIQVYGRVQGVWFRKYAREAALSFDLAGLVKNKPDGTVYIEAEGNEQNLSSFLDWLHQGSPLSEVREVKWEEGHPRQFTEFEIIR